MGVKFKDPETFARSIGVSAKGVATMKSIAAWAAAASTVIGIGSVAIDLIKEVLGGNDPMEEALDTLAREAKNIKDKVIAGQLTEKLDNAAQVHGFLINRAAELRDFEAQRSEQNRQALVLGMRDFKDHLVGRAQFDANRLPFDPIAYQMLSNEPAPAWLAGHGSWSLYYGFDLSAYLAHNPTGPLPTEEQSANSEAMFFNLPGLVQTLRPVAGGAASPFDRSPESLTLNALRWDGRFNFPLLTFGSLVFENVLRAIEPYYRTTGDFRQQLGEVIKALDEFAAAWDAQLLWTSDMPAPNPPQNEAMNLLFGFEEWPCGAVDPVFGTASFQEGWWEPDFMTAWGFGVQTVGLMSAAQGLEHAAIRSASLNWVRAQGLLQLRAMTTAMRGLLMPPYSSPALTSYHDRATQTVASVLQSKPATAKTFNIITPATSYQGTREARHVRVRVPIAIQGNPGLDGIPNLPRYAVSDVTFGYRIELLAQNNQRVTLFDEPLRRRLGEPGVWHTNAAGAAALRSLPWSSTTQTVPYYTKTYLRYVDPSGKIYRRDDLASENVTISCKVAVGDPVSDPIPGLTGEWPSRGVLWLEIESANPLNRSFELHYEVTETTAVGPDGNPTTHDASLVRYRATGKVEVDALVGIFPPEYHEQYERERQTFFDWIQRIHEEYVRAKQRFGPPKPDDKFDRFEDLLELVADPFWAPAVLQQFERVWTGERDISARDALQNGIAQLRQLDSVAVAAPGVALRLPIQPLEQHG